VPGISTVSVKIAAVIPSVAVACVTYEHNGYPDDKQYSSKQGTAGKQQFKTVQIFKKIQHGNTP
jgi:hypothetical protein